MSTIKETGNDQSTGSRNSHVNSHVNSRVNSHVNNSTRDQTLLWMRGLMADYPAAPESAFWAGVVAWHAAIAETSITVRAPAPLLAMMQVSYGGEFWDNTLTIRGAETCAMFVSQWDDVGGLYPGVPDERTKVTETHRLWAHGASLGQRCARDGIPGARAEPADPRAEDRLERLRSLLPRAMADMEAPPVQFPPDITPAPCIDVAWELVPMWKADAWERSSARREQEAADKAARLRRVSTPGPMALKALRERQRQKPPAKRQR